MRDILERLKPSGGKREAAEGGRLRKLEAK